MDYISSASSDEFLVADFASGEYDRVPTFFVDILPRMLSNRPNRTIVYCTDIHALRLDSLMGKLEESGMLDNVRVVRAKLEEMDTNATLRPDMLAYLDERPSRMTALDHHLRLKEFYPAKTFDVGVLNNDIVGYLHEYYTEYSDAQKGLEKVYSVLKSGAILVVTMPCSLYVVDNIQVIESLGFMFVEGIDIKLSDGSIRHLERSADPRIMSRLGHYTFLIFVRE